MAPDEEDYTFESELWQWRADEPGSWFFVTVPEDVSADLRVAAGAPRGFGSIRVEVTLGGSVWRTSVFPQAGTATFALPVKKAVRVAEGLDDGGRVVVRLTLVE